MTRYVVTGAAGFLGSHLVRTLLDRDPNCIVVGLDDFSSSVSFSRHHTALLQEQRYEFYRCDITNLRAYSTPLMNTIVGHLNADDLVAVLNMACPASPPIYQKKSIHTIRTCSVGIMNLLDHMNPHAKFLQASTSEIYGDPDRSPQDEAYWGNVNSYGPRSCYDEGKRLGEAICYEYRRNLEIDARLIRIFNTYGPQMNIDDGRVITNFLKAAHRGDTLQVYGDGTQTRSFCYVDDLVRGILAVLDSDVYEGPVNLGNENEFQINDLLLQINLLLEKEILFQYIPLPENDPLQRKPDISKARRLYGWEPRIELAEGLQKMYNYMVGAGEI